MYLTDMTLNALTFGYLFRHIGITDPPPGEGSAYGPASSKWSKSHFPVSQ